MRWRLQRGSRYVALLFGEEKQEAEVYRAVDDRGSAQDLLRGFLRDELDRATLYDIYRRVTGSTAFSGTGDGRVLDALARRMVRGELKVATPPPPKPQRRVEPKSWMEVQLVDEAGRPVAGEPYKITLPDRTVKEGVTDADGLARVTTRAGGTCKIQFPDLDRDAWEEIER